MEGFVAGDVYVAAFPFSNLQTSKRRPVLVLAKGDYGDIIVCQITSFKDESLNTVKLEAKSFQEGSLPVASYVRVDKLFTADQKLFLSKKGRLSDYKLTEVKQLLGKVLDL